MNIKDIFNEKNRAYIYRVLVGLGAVVSFYGYMTAQEVAMWLGFLTTVLNIMPALNTSTKTE